jgi:hypothetical protein
MAVDTSIIPDMNFGSGPSSSINGAYDLVPFADGPITGKQIRGVYCGTAGTVSLVTQTGRTLTNFPALAGYTIALLQDITAVGTATGVYYVY